MKFYRGAARAARAYVEADHSRADEYYLAEGLGLAERYVATASGVDGLGRVELSGSMDGDAYESWVAGIDPDTGQAKGRVRKDETGLRFVEVVVNGPKTWSIAAAAHPGIASVYEQAQEQAAREVISWLADHATTRVGPRGRQVQIPVEQIEAAVIRHYTSRAGDPHRHLHLQISSRVWAAGAWRGLHSVGVRDSIEAINGIGHAAVTCDPTFRQAVAAHGYTLNEDGDIVELLPFAREFSQRSRQINANLDRYEAAWRRENPGQEPGNKLRAGWDRRAWADARPDKTQQRDGAPDPRQRWGSELTEMGFVPPTRSQPVDALAIGRIDRDAVCALIVSRLGARRSAWNTGDIRGEAEKIIAALGVVTDTCIRVELAEDITARTLNRCQRLLDREDVPEHVRSLTSEHVIAVEAEINQRLAERGETVLVARHRPTVAGVVGLDQAQAHALAALTARLAGGDGLVVVEGPAGAGKTTLLRAARTSLGEQERRMVVLTPTKKAAQVAGEQAGNPAFSAAWFIHQYGYRWDHHGRWHHQQPVTLDPAAVLRRGDVMLIDEAGMLDQDTTRALLRIADQTHALVVFLGDRHQLPAVGRGGALDLATRWVPEDARIELDAVHRFTDPDYASLTLKMRTGEDPEAVFDQLMQRGQIVLHPSEVERNTAIADLAARSKPPLVVADTREQVATLNTLIREQHHTDRNLGDDDALRFTTLAGEQIGIGDRVATRRNDRTLGVANRDTWTLTNINHDSRGTTLTISGRDGVRQLPALYAARYLELAYATTAYGAQGDTVTHAHLLVSDSTGAASAYVAMTRGRETNTAHFVADTIDEARVQWTAVFSRDRADLGPAHAAVRALDDIDRYGPTPTRRLPSHGARRPAPDPVPYRPTPDSPGIGF